MTQIEKEILLNEQKRIFSELQSWILLKREYEYGTPFYRYCETVIHSLNDRMENNALFFEKGECE